MEFEKPLSPLQINEFTSQDSYSLFPMLDEVEEPTNWLNFEDQDELCTDAGNATELAQTCSICGTTIQNSQVCELDQPRKKRRRGSSEEGSSTSVNVCKECSK
jgi:hypothetical protein